MSFPRNTQYERLRAPRTLSDAFGPYAQLHIPPKRYNLRGWCWAIGYGIGIGALLYVVVLVKVGS
ncbi:hypothetical protein [Paraburkholderia sp. RL18-085-BIA-A]|uniref:hypothetical protein n=1 Tax=Paraburkholderia sp. RL18-085-BIA-A TaxID=3031633 RepID=UPI0038BAF140